MTIEAGAPIIRRERHYEQRVVRCFANRPPTVDAMFRAAVERAGDSTALMCETRRVTYRELDAAVEHTAAGFARLGLGKGDRIALLLGNNIEFVVALLAAARLGAISVPMNIRQRRREILYTLNQSAAAAIVYDAILEPEVPEGADVGALRCFIRVGRGGRTGPLPFEDLLIPQPAPAAKVEEEDVLCLLYTSGTTGRPKGAMLTHLGIIHSVLHYRTAFGLDADDVAVLAVPASHVTGLVAILLAMISSAGRTVIMPTFRASNFLALAARERMTYTLVVPAIYNLCLLQPDFRDYALDAWRVGGFGGAPMPAATIHHLAAVLPGLSLYNIYGATETTSPVTILPARDMLSRPDSVGLALPCCDVMVADDEGRELPRGEPGELWIAGSNIVPGYWDDPEATRGAFVGGYWLSGDIGSIDEHGYVRVFDRKKDVINRGGFKIYSIEVENELARHSAVLECAVLGRPDPVLGEKVEAFVVLRPEAMTTAQDLRSYCALSMSDYKVPDVISFVAGALPRNANGKVLKGELRGSGAR